MTGRLAEIRAIGNVALLGAEQLGTRATLRFRPGADIHTRLAAVVAAESKCCAFFDMTLRNDLQSIELVVNGPAGAEAILADLVAAFDGRSRAT